MNRKQLSILIAAVIVVGGLGLWLRGRSTASYHTTEGRMGQKVLGEFDVNSIARIVVKQGTNELNLARQDDRWTVAERANYPANFSEVSDFLRKVWELKIIEPVQVGSSQLARLELTPPAAGSKAGTLIELKDQGGKTVKSLLLGKKHMRQAAAPSQFGGDEGWPDGRYVMADNSPQSVSLVSEAFSNIDPKPEQWLSKDFFRAEKVRSVSVTFPNATNSWKITRETESGEFKLADAKPEEKLDPSKASAIPNALAFPSFNDVLVNPKPEETGLATPTVVTMDTFENFTYTINVGGKTNDENFHLTVAVTAEIPKERTPGKDEKAEDKDKLDKEFKEKTQRLNDKLKLEQSFAKSTYVVSKWTVEGVLKERHQLMVEKKDESKAAPGGNPSGADAKPDDDDQNLTIPPLPDAPEKQ